MVVARLATGYVMDTLREGDDLKLVCDVQSNPLPSRVIWYHNVSRKLTRGGEREKKNRKKRISLAEAIHCYSSVLVRRTDVWSTT